MIVFEQGALDSLYAARAAIERAIFAYEGKASEEGKRLSTLDGPLFETNDNLDTVIAEVQAFRDIANKDRS